MKNKEDVHGGASDRDFLRDCLSKRHLDTCDDSRGILGPLSSVSWCTKAKVFFALDAVALPLIEPSVALETACNDIVALVTFLL